MSYGLAAALQSAIYQRLTSDPNLSALVGGAVFDALPQGDIPELYIGLGPEEVKDASDLDGSGAVHRFTLSVVSARTGFAAAKTVAAAINDALFSSALILDRGRLVGLWFERAHVRRDGKAGRVRRIDLKFRARVEDN
ncbi:DUF3168 domain-containing protein [Primorskyibacter sp. S87]|uniref:DUF3168 domain-containing protein n=1 Tax=Primorskyibacter sp. S87 TaxID=3415126 RepID=UPI003C79974D